MSFDLFPQDGGAPQPAPDAPLAERMRPRTIGEVVGQEHLTAPGRLLHRAASGGTLPSLIFWGPPGTGKTTLARILAHQTSALFVGVSAVSAGVKEIRAAVGEARTERRRGRRTVLFLDEIHRFNKAQQDALLPHVESGLLVLLGATTENPSFEVNSALLSRCRVVVTKSLDQAALLRLLDRACRDPRGLAEPAPSVEDAVRDALVGGADGDARRMLNTLEVAAELCRGDGRTRLTLEDVGEAQQSAALRYDRAGEEHYNLISALHKSVRAGDPQAAVYWTQRMLISGEDPLYLARRLVRMSVEDIGLADPHALTHSLAAQQAVHFLGLPEGSVALTQAAVYLALAPKSNRIYVAEKAARETIERTGSLAVPLAFRNAPTALMKGLGYGAGYRYDHDEPEGTADQNGLPEELGREVFYRPTRRGFEEELARRLHEREARIVGGEPPGEDQPPDDAGEPGSGVGD